MTPEEELYLFQRISQMADKYIPTKKLLSIHGITFHQAFSEAENWRRISIIFLISIIFAEIICFQFALML